MMKLPDWQIALLCNRFYLCEAIVNETNIFNYIALGTAIVFKVNRLPLYYSKYYVNIPVLINHFYIGKPGWYGIKLSDYSIGRYFVCVGCQSNPYVVEIMAANDIETYSVPLDLMGIMDCKRVCNT